MRKKQEQERNISLLLDARCFMKETVPPVSEMPFWGWWVMQRHCFSPRPALAHSSVDPALWQASQPWGITQAKSSSHPDRAGQSSSAGVCHVANPHAQPERKGASASISPLGRPGLLCSQNAIEHLLSQLRQKWGVLHKVIPPKDSETVARTRPHPIQKIVFQKSRTGGHASAPLPGPPSLYPQLSPV